MQVKWSWCVVVCVCAAKDEGKLEKKGVGKVVLMYCILCVCTVLCVGGCEAHAFAAKGDWKLEKKGVSEAVLISSVCVRCVCVCMCVCVCGKRRLEVGQEGCIQNSIDVLYCMCLCSKIQWRRKRSHCRQDGRWAGPPMGGSSSLTTMNAEQHGSVRCAVTCV